MAYLFILDVVLILLIIQTDTGHRNSEIYQAMQMGVLHSDSFCMLSQVKKKIEKLRELT